MSPFSFVSNIQLLLDPTGQESVILHAGIRRLYTPFVKYTDEPAGIVCFYLPVVQNEGFSLHVRNNTHALAAFPARIGDGEH